MTEPKKCDIWITQGSPTKVHCFTCDKTFAALDMPMTKEVLKSVCDSYKERCSMFTREAL